MSTTRTADLQGEAVTYQVRRSEDASRTRIDAGLEGITLVIPAGLEVNPDDIMAEKADWVLRQRDRYARYRDEMPERQFEEGERFLVLGKERPIEITPIPESKVTDDAIQLSRTRVENTSLREELEHLYRETSREHFTARADHFCEAMGAHYEQIQIRNQKTRWGSYSPRTGTLSLNFRLLMAPREVVDYVIAHELAHEEHPNHGPRFWRLVAQHMPDYQERGEWLEENGHRLVFSGHSDTR
jgi:predicted metal-dependent hydrolase